MKNNIDKGDMPTIGFVRIPQILAVLPISKSTWWAWVAEGKAPAPVKLGPSITAWKAEDIIALIERFNSESQAA